MRNVGHVCLTQFTSGLFRYWMFWPRLTFSSKCWMLDVCYWNILISWSGPCCTWLTSGTLSPTSRSSSPDWWTPGVLTDWLLECFLFSKATNFFHLPFNNGPILASPQWITINFKSLLDCKIFLTDRDQEEVGSGSYKISPSVPDSVITLCNTIQPLQRFSETCNSVIISKCFHESVAAGVWMERMCLSMLVRLLILCRSLIESITITPRVQTESFLLPLIFCNIVYIQAEHGPLLRRSEIGKIYCQPR